MDYKRISSRQLRILGSFGAVAAGSFIVAAIAGLVSNGHLALAGQNGRIWRELITVSITAPTTKHYLWINEELPYSAAATCTDQFSDDGGATWHDLGPDTLTPEPAAASAME